MRCEFPYVRVMLDRTSVLPSPPTMIELDGLPHLRTRYQERTGYLHSDLPMQWQLPAIRAALADVGIQVPDDFVQRGDGWLAWVDIDLSRPVPDLSMIAFTEYAQVPHGR
jgi:hypothetical protein